MLTPPEANLLLAFLKNAKPQAVTMEQSVREAINYQRCVELIGRETMKAQLVPPPLAAEPADDFVPVEATPSAA